ncbi:MAG: hypothetical protein MRJ68_15350 [Nitrospira sp.]|nr:hypothetical protein [Nitrospira sp.]
MRWITARGYELQRVWSSVKLTAVFLLAIVGVGCAAHKAPLSQVITKPACDRLITANVVALEQVYYYNRFGAFNPAGIMYALRRDVVKTGDGKEGDRRFSMKTWMTTQMKWESRFLLNRVRRMFYSPAT